MVMVLESRIPLRDPRVVLGALSQEEATMRFKIPILIIAMVAFTAASVGAQSILTGGTQTPFKLSRTPGGNFVLAESGTGENDGRISLLSLWGHRFNLLSGLPSGTVPQGDHIGPTA